MEHFEQNPLKGRVIEKYGSLSNFASAINWSNRKVSYIVNKKQSATANEIEKMAEMLDANEARDFMNLFYPNMSIKWTSTADAKGA